MDKETSIAIAEMVLPIFEKHFPQNTAPREAIEASKLYNKNLISKETLLKKAMASANAATHSCHIPYVGYAAAAASATMYAVTDRDNAVPVQDFAIVAAGADLNIKNQLLSLLAHHGLDARLP
jgi:hypothetical protein